MMRSPSNTNHAQSGLSFIEVLVGTFLLLVVFLGIFGAYRLGVRVTSQSRARVTATALANQKIELARNLAYNDVGTVGGIPAGTIPETENITRNGIAFTVKTTVVFIDDPFDGTAPDDTLPNDYKRVRVRASWDAPFSGEVILLTDVAPKGLETNIGGGNLSVTVFDALGVPVSGADVHVVNNAVVPAIDANFQTNTQGKVLIAGAPASVESYEITVTKSGYSTERTYGTNEIANPEKPHVTVIEGSLTQASFSIDILGTFSVDTLSPFGSGSFSDSFFDSSRVSLFNNTVVADGFAELASSSGYAPSGDLTSITITPTELRTWNEFSWNDTEPVDTDARYHVLFFDGLSWDLIPDSDLSGNSTGFDSSPVDLSLLATTTYSELRVRGALSTSHASTTPAIADWEVSWITGEATAIAAQSFFLQGEKIIGTDMSENPVYTYAATSTTDASGHITIANMEWDAYTFSVFDQNLSLVDIIPSPQPVDLLPGATQNVSLFLSAEHNLIVTVKNSETAESVFSASVRLFNAGAGYDTTQFTDTEGQTLFIPLDALTYSYEISASGYTDAQGTISVNGNTTKTITLIPSGL